MFQRCVTVLVFFTLLTASVNLSAQDFSRYHTYDQLSRELHSMVDANSSIARLESIGRTAEGRDLWIIEIANQQGVPTAERPALFIGANFEGSHVIGSELALYIVNYLLTNYESNEDVRRSIDNYVYYILPRSNPDAAEMMFGGVRSGRKTNTTQYDGDNDGRMDEDGPRDLNNDGFITVMRVKDLNGEYMIDPDEPRLMKKADPAKGETGAYAIYWEGIDDDKDGFINEDPPGGIDINRNFQHEYPYYSPDAGPHMLCETESRALMDWMLERRNIAVMLTFGESDNLITAPDSKGKLGPAQIIGLASFADAGLNEAGKVGMFRKANPRLRGMGAFRGEMTQGQQTGPRRPAGRKPAVTVDSADIEYFTTVSETYREVTGIAKQPPVRTPEGAFFQFGYYQFGVLSFSTPGWGLAESDAGEKASEGRPEAGRSAQRRGSNDSSFDKQLLDWMDTEGVDGFVNWTQFNHPDLGDVEIGGFKPYAVVNPPAAKIASLGDSHASFALYLTTLFPKIEIAETEAVSHGGGLFTIKAEVMNAGYLPTSLQHGVVSRSVKPTMVQLGIDAANIISGNAKTNFIRKLDGSGKREKFEWIVKGRAGDSIELKVVSQKGGSDTTVITLK